MLARFLALLVRLAFLSSITLLISGIGHAVVHPAPNQSGPAGRAIRALAEGEATRAVIPAAFVEFAGYRPVSSGTTLIKPTGSCSWTGGMGPVGFVPTCRTHDLGYDLLRFAEANGERLGPWARLELDRRFSSDLRAACDNRLCDWLASVYGAVVAVNSIRQGYMAPMAEPILPWLMGGLALVLVAMPAPPIPAFRRRSRSRLLPA